MSGEVERSKCYCGAVIPTSERIADLFKSRTLHLLRQEINCLKFKKFDFKESQDCQLVHAIEDRVTILLDTFKDVIHKRDDPTVLLEALNVIPKGNLVDSTGDYGKELSIFLLKCIKENHIDKIGSIVDVGGQNSSTVNIISNLLKNDVSSLIVDMNFATPAVSAQQDNIKYVIDDAFSFFSSSSYEQAMKDVILEHPTLFIFNNLLNVLQADDGWKTLKSVWNRLRVGDYLVISGISPEQLEKRFERNRQNDGIIEFHHNNSFYKSALAPEFSDFLQNNLKNCLVLTKEHFERENEKNSRIRMKMKGYRMLTLRKNS